MTEPEWQETRESGGWLGLWRQAGVRLFVYRLLLAILFFGLWQYAADRWISSFWIGNPAKIWRHLIEIYRSGALFRDMWVTLQEAVYGYLIGAITGIAFGFILGRLQTIARVLDPFIVAFYGVPRIALAPLFIIWFGIGITSKIVLAATVVFFLAFFSTFSGVKSVDPELKNLVRVMGASERQVLQKIVLPAASPWIIAGLKMSVPQALVGAVVGEFMAASKGLGYKIQYDSTVFNTTGTMAGILILAAIVVVGNDLLDRLERRALRWRTREGSGDGEMADLR